MLVEIHRLPQGLVGIHRSRFGEHARAKDVLVRGQSQVLELRREQLARVVLDESRDAALAQHAQQLLRAPAHEAFEPEARGAVRRDQQAREPQWLVTHVPVQCLVGAFSGQQHLHVRLRDLRQCEHVRVVEVRERCVEKPRCLT